MKRLGVGLGSEWNDLVGEGGGVMLGFSVITGSGVATRLMGEGVEEESLGRSSGELGDRCARRRGPIGVCGGLPENREVLWLELVLSVGDMAARITVRKADVYQTLSA